MKSCYELWHFWIIVHHKFWYDKKNLPHISQHFSQLKFELLFVVINEARRFYVEICYKRSQSLYRNFWKKNARNKNKFQDNRRKINKCVALSSLLIFHPKLKPYTLNFGRLQDATQNRPNAFTQERTPVAAIICTLRDSLAFQLHTCNILQALTTSGLHTLSL